MARGRGAAPVAPEAGASEGREHEAKQAEPIERAAAARATLDALIGHNPEFRSPEGHLLYARALEAEGNVEKALAEYAVLAPAYPGAEGTVRYAQLLEAQGRRAEAQKLARELIEQARIAPRHYRQAQREWLEAAARLL